MVVLLQLWLFTMDGLMATDCWNVVTLLLFVFVPGMHSLFYVAFFVLMRQCGPHYRLPLLLVFVPGVNPFVLGAFPGRRPPFPELTVTMVLPPYLGWGHVHWDVRLVQWNTKGKEFGYE